MKNITEIDKNFKLETSIDIKGIKFFDIDNEPFKIYGVFKEDGLYRRLPEEIAKNTSDGVYSLHANTAGGRVRFKTNSPYVAINVVYENAGKMGHFAPSGSIGLDLYVTNENGKEKYHNTFIPPYDIKDSYESVTHFGNNDMRQITINLPTYSSVKNLYIGLDENAEVLSPDEYAVSKPILYYGSSITQGGCTSRPGNTYEAIISRKFNADYINLGFSGNAKGEDIMADYIKNIPMSVFVYDYDHNAPTIEHLENTHERFYLRIREANPDLPIIFMTAPIYSPDDFWKSRKELIRKNYEKAVAAGDKNVYFIDGKDLMKIAKDDGTVDGCHPTDLGFFSIAEAVIEVLSDIL